MSLRLRILLASLGLTFLPLMVVMQITRGAVAQRFTELDSRRMADQMRLARQDLLDRSETLAARLQGLTETMAADNRLRRALLETDDDGTPPPYLLDYAPRRMSLMDLDLLQIQDPGGRVLSSGHFRQSFGEELDQLPRLLATVPAGRALVPARTAEGSFLAVARTTSVSLGGVEYDLVGGFRLDPGRLRDLSGDDDLQIVLAWPGGVMSTDPDLTRRLEAFARPEEIPLVLRREDILVNWSEWPLLAPGQPRSAYLIITHDQSALQVALRRLDLRLGLILAVALLITGVVAVWTAGRLSRPLRQLSANAEALDLDRLDVRFAGEGADEVGRLARLLNEMTRRLRAGVDRLRDAEHRATLGEVSRQVNHDIRNGLTPLRNVLRHLGEVAEQEPARLDAVFNERRGTLESGLAYLEDLAAHYARLSPERRVGILKLDQVIGKALAAQTPPDEVRLENRLPVNLPPVEADPVSLRRIFDNLLRNALQSLPPEGGTVAVSGFVEEDHDLEEMRIQVEVADTGVGIAPENLDRVFDDFFTTRPEGTGLGLSNVRRLAADCGARVKVQSEVGSGTTFILSFPLPRLPRPDQEEGFPHG